ncbi:MAG: fibronectin type III domain-containing protein [Actinomycetota bacterium]
MSDQMTAPEFNDNFWATVDARVDRVRDLTREELACAEQGLLFQQVEAQVVPVFPGPFWTRVNKRASGVRTLALDELADAEERLINAPEEQSAPWRSRIPVPALLRRIPRPRTTGLPLRARTNTIGFVTAVLAVLLLLPQVAPISSLADIGSPRGPLAIFFSAEPTESSPEDSGETGSGSRSSNATSNATNRPRAGSGSTSAGRAGTTAAPSGAGEPGAAGQSPAAGTASPGDAGTAASGATGAGEAASSAAGAAGTTARPAAPSNLVLTAIDDTTVRLRWRDQSENETGFVIERNGDPTERRIAEPNQKSFIWQGLVPNSEACFKVRARNSAGASSWLPEDYRCVKTYESQPAGGPVVLEAVACTNESTLPSLTDVQETQITFNNQTGRAVMLVELGQEGVRDLTPLRLEPGASTTVNTFLGNPFVVTRDDEAAGCMAIYLGRSWTSVANITEPA